MDRDDVVKELSKPIAEDLLRSAHLAHLAYTGTDGFPRAVPVAFHWDGARVVVYTAPMAPKVGALRARPEAALCIDTDTQPPRVLLMRGIASVEVVDGVPDEFIAANSKGGGEQDREAFEAQVRALYDQMAVVSIEPRWAKLLDFETTLPSAVEEIVRRKMPGRLPDM